MNECKFFDPDRQLVERAANGDVNAFERLITQNKQQIYRTIFRITKIREDAEDQMQETFMRAYRGLKYFQGNSKFKTWLTQIAVNQALMCLRKRRNNLGLPVRSENDPNSEELILLDVAESRPNPEQQWAQTEMANHLEAEVNRLPKGLRSAFILRHVHEYTSIEVAMALGISTDAVKSRVLRARRKLRERIEKSSGVLV